MGSPASADKHDGRVGAYFCLLTSKGYELMIKSFGLAKLVIVSAFGLWATQALAQTAFYDQYGIYPLTPKGPPYGLGAVMVGFFDSSGKQLRVRTEGGEGLICRAKVEVKPEEIKNCSAQQASVTNTQQKDRTFDLTAGIKQVLTVSGNAKYIRKVSVKVTNGCLFQLSTVEAQKLLDSDPDCLRAAKNERAMLSKVPLDKKLREGGYLLLWQTTRVLHANVEYVVDFTRGAGMSVKTDAAKAIKDISGSITGNVTDADKLELKGEGLWIGLAPRYYEQWYHAPDAAKIAKTNVEKLAKNQKALAEKVNERSTAVPKIVTSVKAAGAETDKKVEKALEAAK
jgi:hypothetical protein